MAITTLDQLVTAAQCSQDQLLFFPSGTTVAGGWICLNLAVACSPFGKLAAPALYSAGGTTYNQLSTGVGYPKWSPAGAGKQTYIIGGKGTYSAAGTVHVYDLLWGCTGFSGIVTTAQAVTGFSGMPARNTTGANGEIWVHCTTALGATAPNITVSYTNQSGVAGRTTVSTAMIASMPAYRMFQVPLQNGDTGVQSIQSVTLSASTGTAGSFGVMVMDRLFAFGSPVASILQAGDFATLGMPTVNDSAVIAFVHQGAGTSSGVIMGRMILAQG